MMKKIIIILILTISSVILFQTTSLAVPTVAPPQKHPTLEGDQTVNPVSSPISFAGLNDHVYDVNGNLTINASIPGNTPYDRTGVIFIKQNLTFNQNYDYVSPNAGTVFVVKGDVKIADTVTRIDAIIISEGEICTATQSGICPSTNITTSQLVINGSLISLTSDDTKKLSSAAICHLTTSQPKKLTIKLNI